MSVVSVVTEHLWGTSMEWLREAHKTEVLCVGTVEGGYSRLHMHAALDNSFFVGTGTLDIQIREDGHDRFERLGPIQHLTIPAGTLHRLIVVEPGTFSETYTWADGVSQNGPPNPKEDIVGVEPGGTCFCP